MIQYDVGHLVDKIPYVLFGFHLNNDVYNNVKNIFLTHISPSLSLSNAAEKDGKYNF